MKKYSVCYFCPHAFEEHEHYVITKEGKSVCEQCFFDYALAVLRAREKEFNTEEVSE